MKMSMHVFMAEQRSVTRFAGVGLGYPSPSPPMTSPSPTTCSTTGTAARGSSRVGVSRAKRSKAPGSLLGRPGQALQRGPEG